MIINIPTTTTTLKSTSLMSTKLTTTTTRTQWLSHHHNNTMVDRNKRVTHRRTHTQWPITLHTTLPTRHTIQMSRLQRSHTRLLSSNQCKLPLIHTCQTAAIVRSWPSSLCSTLFWTWSQLLPRLCVSYLEFCWSHWHMAEQGKSTTLWLALSWWLLALWLSELLEHSQLTEDEGGECWWWIEEVTWEGADSTSCNNW